MVSEHSSDNRPYLCLLGKGRMARGIREEDISDMWKKLIGQGDSQVSLGQLVANAKWVQSC